LEIPSKGFQARRFLTSTLLDVSEASRDQRLSPDELAAWSIVARVILNLDEMVTKNQAFREDRETEELNP
jgi:hypothetical protein